MLVFSPNDRQTITLSTTDQVKLPLNRRSAAHNARKPHRTARQAGSGETDTRVNQDALEMAEKLTDACDVFLREASRSYLHILQQFGVLT